MVDITKLKARMVLAGYNQRTLTEECRERGYKTSENTISAKFNSRSPWTCDDADMLCDVLNIQDPAEKAEIFLA
ncbi:MAG: hypothetical protein IKA94_07385 [Mogibacterium sp.]|jgi:hypothetical protein|nr:hypothetical protein [Mogibacterium sp.]